MEPIFYHANGKNYAGDDVMVFYEGLKQAVLSRPAPEEGLPGNVLLLTYSNFKDKQDLELICEHLGIPVTVLGQTDSQRVADVKFRVTGDDERWLNLNRPIYLQDFIDTHDLSGIDYMVVLDDCDVVIDGSIFEAVRRFEGMGCEALFNAEVNCFSTDEFKPQQDAISAQLGKRRMYLNAGCYITRVGFLRTMLKVCFDRQPASTDDQIIFHRVYVTLYPRVKIDHDEVVFKTLFRNMERHGTDRAEQGIVSPYS